MMASQRAKPSIVGDLLIHTMRIDTENLHEHQNHGLLSPSASISRSHEGREEFIDPHGKPSILRLSSPELGENTTTGTRPLLTSHSLSYENGQERKESTESNISSPTRSHIAPPTNVHIDVSEASKQQSTEVAQQTSSLPTPTPSTPVNAQKPPIEFAFPKTPGTQVISQLSSKKRARRMAPRKTPTPPIPLNIHILALADRHAHPYASVAPKYTFTLRVVPDTTIREAGVQAGIYLKGRSTTPVDSDRFEARDENGHVFDGTEMIGQELGAGGELYLIEDAIDVKEVRKTWLHKMDSMETSVRTPKSKKVNEPRKTPSERNKEIADEGKRMVRTEPRKRSVQPSRVRRARSESRRRSLSLAPLELEDSNPSPDQPVLSSPKPQQEKVVSEPVIESIEDSPQEGTLEKLPQLKNNGTESGRDFEVTEASSAPVRSVSRRVGPARPMKPDNASNSMVQPIEHVQSLAKSATNSNPHIRPAVASQHKLPRQDSMAVGPPLDSSVVPDSQEQPSQVNSPPRDEIMSNSFTPINARRPPGESKSFSAPRQKASTERPLNAEKDGIKPDQPSFPLGKIDPYDISSVLSEDEYYSPRPSKTIMSTSVRKLGSARKRTTPASASIPRNSLLIAQEDPPPAAQQSHPKPPPGRATSTASAREEERPTIPSTPLASAGRTPSVQAELSSGLGPLLSSPTNHVAAALARGRAKARRQPQPECCVIEDSDVEVLGDVLVDSQLQITDSPKQFKSLEASLPWSAPPLRLGGEDPFWTLRTTGRRPSVRRESDVDEGVNAEVHDNGAKDSKEHAVMPGISSEALAPLKTSTSNISSFNLGPPVKEPEKRISLEQTPKPLVKGSLNTHSPATPGKSPLLLVHGSSSSEQGVEEIGYVDDTLAKDKPVSPVEGEKVEVIQISSDQDEVEDEDETHDFMAGQVLAEALFGDEELIEPHEYTREDNGLALPVDNETCISETNEMPDNIPVTIKDQSHLSKEPSQNSQNSKTDTKSNEEVIEDTPPSVQPPKRKHDSSDGIDSEEERRTAKRARREAKKAEKKRLRKEKLTQEERKKREHEARLQEERKRLAMEKAYQRARELELVVSSPSKAAEMGLGFSDAYDSDQESELGSSPPERAVVPPVFDVSDDSLESKESEESQSWRQLSKRHFSASPSSSLKGDVPNGPGNSSALSTSGVTFADEVVSAVLTDPKSEAPQRVEKSTATKIQAQQRSLEDWAFVETTMGVSAYSPLQVHDRIHMQMVLAALQGHTSRGGIQQVEDSNLSRKMGDDGSAGVLVKSQPDALVTRQDGIRPIQSKKKAQTQESAAEDDDDEEESVITDHTTRSPAPSPKDLTVAREQQTNNGRQQHKKAQTKGQRRKSKDNTRKKKRRQKAKHGNCKDTRRMHAFRVRGKRQ